MKAGHSSFKMHGWDLCDHVISMMKSAVGQEYIGEKDREYLKS